MERIEIYKNQNGIETETALCGTAQKAVQSIWNEFNTLGIDLSIDSIFELINVPFYNGKNNESTKDSIKNAIIDAQTEAPKIFGIAVSREQLKKMIDVPNLETIVKVLHGNENNFNRVKDYIFIENGRAQIITDYVTHIVQRNTSFAEGEKQLKRANLLIKLRNDLNEYLKADFAGYGYNLPELKGLTAKGAEYVIDIAYITGN